MISNSYKEEPDAIPLDQYTGNIVGIDEIQSPSSDDELDAIPLDQFNGKARELNKTEALQELIKTGISLKDDIISQDMISDQTNLAKTISNLVGNVTPEQVKSALSIFRGIPEGIGATADLPKDIGSFTADVMGQPNIGTDDLGMPLYSSSRPLDRNAPDVSFQQKAGEAYDKFAGTENTHGGLAEIPETGLRWATEFLTGGILKKVGKKAGSLILENLGKLIGEADLQKALNVGIAGSAMEGTKQATGSDAAGFGAALLTPSGASKMLTSPYDTVIDAAKKTFISTKNPVTKLEGKLLGLDKKNLKTDLLDAGDRIGVSIPASAATDSGQMEKANSFITSLPLIGNKPKQIIKDAQEQFKESFNRLADSVGEKASSELDEKISDLYTKHRKALPDNAQIKPVHTLEAIDKAIDRLKKTFIIDPDTTGKTISILEKGAKGMRLDKFVPPAPVDYLIGTKQNLGNMIKWDKDEKAKNLLRNIHKTINKDIAEYGKLNPEWYAEFQKADRLFEQAAKREKIDKLFENKISKPESGETSYNAFLKIANDPQKREILEKNFGKEGFEKLQDFVKVADGMQSISRNVDNKSRTAYTTKAMDYIKEIGKAATAFFIGKDLAKNTKRLIGLTGGSLYLRELLTNKEFLEIQKRFAIEPKDSLANQLNKIAIKVTKKPLAIIAQEMTKESRSN